MTEQCIEAADQLSLIKAKLLDGSIGAISLDTCIFSRAGYRLDQGNLKRLEQFKNNTFRFVLSEITLREVMRHIAAHSEKEKTKFLTGLRGIAKFWTVDPAKQAAVESDLLQELEPKDLAKKRVIDFATRCGALIIEAKQVLDVSELLKCYFKTLPPFEASGDKKSEFPDAMVNIGSAEVSARDTIDVDVLITFLNPDSAPEIDRVELVPARRHIDFGSVGPDYGDEDPNSEYY